MAVVAEGPSDERSSQQEVTLVPHASQRIVSMGMPRWVWSVVGVEMCQGGPYDMQFVLRVRVP